MRRIDLTGQRFGKLTALECHSEFKSGKHRVMWKCLCDCGKTTYVVADNLRGGQARSCGCSKKEFFRESKKRVNSYTVTGDTTTIYTKNGTEVTVDTDDLDRLLKICWVDRINGYIGGRDMETGKLVLIHRYILKLNPEDGMVDHINRNPRDNRKANLRICTASQNNMNKKVAKNSSSGVNGVSFIKERNKWLSRIMKDGVLYELGAYEDISDAIKARKEAEIKIYGEFAPR